MHILAIVALWALLVPGVVFASELAKLRTGDLKDLLATPLGGEATLALEAQGKVAPAEVVLRRIDPYAKDARIVVVDADGEREIGRSTWLHFYGREGSRRIALSLSPDGRQVDGLMRGADGALTRVSGRKDVFGRLKLQADARMDRAPGGQELESGCDGGRLPGAESEGTDPALAHPPPAKATDDATRQAVLSIDTDNEFMAQTKIANNTTTANNYLASLVSQLNVMYEADLDVTLVLGQVFLRVAADPYTTTSASSTSASLDEFSEYWRLNYANNKSPLVLMLSGKSAGEFSSSGVAWVIKTGVYCDATGVVLQGGGTFGHFAVNRVFEFQGSTAADDVRVSGHELGHVLGVDHTHCTNGSGVAPTNAGTLDQCFNGESGRGCYAGTPACPLDFPNGSIMSYCNFGPSSGANCGQDVQLQFHPVHKTLLNARIATNFPACITVSVANRVFADGFETP